MPFPSWFRRRQDPGAAAVSLHLPATRPRTLTPSTSRDSLTTSGSATSPFFAKLSFELRAAILAYAFGDRNVHMNLMCLDPRKSPTPPANSAPRHAAHAGFPKSGSRDVRYMWSGSVCHRAMSGRLGTRGDPGPADDPCHRIGPAAHQWCEEWPGDFPMKCRIGVMGFLLSCRQAYTEAIDILYHTNTLHIESTLMAANLSAHLLPQRLSRIASLEMAWQLSASRFDENPGQARLQPAQAPERAFRHLLSGLAALPNLRKLALAVVDNANVDWKDVPWDDALAWAEREIVAPVDAALLKLPCLENFHLMLPGSIYQPLRVQAKGAPFEAGWGVEPELERVWHVIPESAMHHPLLRGYWLSISRNDYPLAVASWSN